MARKNLVFICTDQLRFDALSANGNPVVRTNHIDRVAAAGMSFRRHHTPNQICSPSRASMATGLLPRHHGLWRNGVLLDPAIPTLWSMLRQAGWRTHAAGKLHYQPLLAPAELAMPESLAYWDRADAKGWNGPYYGFDEVDLVLGEANESTRAGHYAEWLRSEHPGVAELYEPQAAAPESRTEDLAEVWRSAVPAELHYTNWIADKAVRFIAERSASTPFCLYVSFPDPHHPFAPPHPYSDLYDPASMPRPKTVDGELDRMPAYLKHGDDPRRDAYIGAGENVREQGFLLRTDAISERTLSIAVAHTFGMVKMIDDAVGRILAALKDAGRADDTYVLFTSDHGELLGDHGLLRKGPPPYRQLLQVPLVIAGPDIPAGRTSEALTSHVDLVATLTALLGVPAGETDGCDLSPILRGESREVRDALFAEYHPRKDGELYNQTIIVRDWRYTRYPNRPGWEEFFDLRRDPWEHENLASGVGTSDEIRLALRDRLDREMPSRPHIPKPPLGAY